MLRAEAIQDLVALLKRRQACLWHACNYQDFLTYLVLGGIPSRALLEQSGLAYTGFETDEADHVNGVWDKVFVNLSDFGALFAHGYHAVPNPYGPIVLQIKPDAMIEATDVAVCLRSAGACDFDRDAEALASVDLVDKLYRYRIGSPFPASTEVLSGRWLSAVFPQAKSSSPEISCTVPSGWLSIDYVAVVWTDPYQIARRTLKEWVIAALEGHGKNLVVQERHCSNGIRRSMYGDLLRLVREGCRSLLQVVQSQPVDDPMRDWARSTLDNGIDYNFQRYADYLRHGTIQPLETGTIPQMPPPQGAYAEKFSRIMALKRQATPEAIGELVAALGDEDEKVRWLASSTLGGLKDERVVVAVRSFAQRTESAEGRDVAERLLTTLG